jgi:hypothetical protein
MREGRPLAVSRRAIPPASPDFRHELRIESLGFLSGSEVPDQARRVRPAHRNDGNADDPQQRLAPLRVVLGSRVEPEHEPTDESRRIAPTMWEVDRP